MTLALQILDGKKPAERITLVEPQLWENATDEGKAKLEEAADPDLERDGRFVSPSTDWTTYTKEQIIACKGHNLRLIQRTLTAGVPAPRRCPRPNPTDRDGRRMTELLLDATGVAKSYGAVAALRNASLSVRPGEVHALMGANGAGKTTLVKILTGAVRPDAGRILIRGQDRDVRSPAEARRAGLVSVYQEPSLIPDLDDRLEPAC